jgi:hypothetical protein
LLSVGRGARSAPPPKQQAKRALGTSSWGGKTSAYGAGFSSENFEIGSPNVRSTIDSGHWEKLKLFVFPSSFSIPCLLKFAPIVIS